MAANLKLQIPVIAEGIVWMTVLGNLQLALRHPQNTGESAPIVREFCLQLGKKLLEENVLSREEYSEMLRDELRHGKSL